jgi:glycosyl transferase family 25
MRAIVINLERRKDRLEYINNNYKSNLYDLELFSAFDTKYLETNPKEYIDLKDKFINNIDINRSNNQNYPYYYFNSFTPGELGCFMSHLIIWKKIIDENIDQLIVYEDDCIFNLQFNIRLNTILSNEIPNDFNIIFLGGKMVNNYTHNYNIMLSENIYIKKDPEPYGTFSYIISKKGAELLYNYAFNEFRGNLGVDYFIDEFLKKNNHKIHVISPFICYSMSNNDQDNIFKSDIH